NWGPNTQGSVFCRKPDGPGAVQYGSWITVGNSGALAQRCSTRDGGSHSPQKKSSPSRVAAPDTSTVLPKLTRYLRLWLGGTVQGMTPAAGTCSDPGCGNCTTRLSITAASPHDSVAGGRRHGGRGGDRDLERGPELRVG